MKTFTTLFLSFLICVTTVSDVKAQCNTNTNICSVGISGPFTFTSPGQQVSTCLDFLGPGYAYIILYITSAGPLEMLIDGDASSGYLDVAIFDIPTGVTPCNAILNNSNQISCNYASAASGCNQIGNYFSCSSSVSSPYVNVGDRLMIIVENWSGSSSSFTLDMAPAPAAQSGPGDPSITPIPVMLTTGSSPYQMSAVDNGGVWSGTGVNSTGLFDPSTTGIGTFTLTHDLGSGPCLVTDTIDVAVGTALAIELSDLQLDCKDNKQVMQWSTATEVNCDYFRIEKSFDAKYFTTVDVVNGHGNSSTILNYNFIDKNNEGQNYYRLVEVDYNGSETIYGPLSTTCENLDISIYPNLVKDNLKVNMPNSDKTVTYEIKSVTGKLIASNTLNGAINVSNLSRGYYIIILDTEDQQFVHKFIRQ